MRSASRRILPTRSHRTHTTALKTIAASLEIGRSDPAFSHGGDSYDDDVLYPSRYGFKTIWKPRATLIPDELYHLNPFARAQDFPYNSQQPAHASAILLSLRELPAAVTYIEHHCSLMDYSDALKIIAQPIRATNLPHTLDHLKRLLAALDNPEKTYPCVVVAGSVGKGSTCHQIAALMNDQLKVGLYTSPHLHSFRERFAINRHLISQMEFIATVEIVQKAAADLDTHYSTFELATALALYWFRQQAVDIAVLEIGIGGRYDAVNAVSNALAVITPIEREHAAMLGGTLAAIASHKAGIIQPYGFAIAAPQVAEVEAVLRHEAASQHAAITFESSRYYSCRSLR